MLKMDKKGIAVVSVAVIVLATAGGAVAAPVVVDAVDVDPDHPLYALERLGERIRRVSDDDQIEERFEEYQRMVVKGKALKYRAILGEFKEKMEKVVPEDIETKAEIIAWMQQQMPRVGVIKANVLEEVCHQLKEDLPEVGELDNLCEKIENCKLLAWENIDTARACWELCRERIENIVHRYRYRVRERARKCLEIDNILVDIDIYIAVKVRIHPIIDLAENFTEKLEEFDNMLAEVQAMLEGAPENLLGHRAAERLVEVAIRHKDMALIAYDEGRTRRALGLICAAKMNLYSAKLILEHASEWEPEFREEWIRWKEGWENLKQELIDEGIWENILENWQQHAENVRQRWRLRP